MCVVLCGEYVVLCARPRSREPKSAASKPRKSQAGRSKRPSPALAVRSHHHDLARSYRLFPGVRGRSPCDSVCGGGSAPVSDLLGHFVQAFAGINNHSLTNPQSRPINRPDPPSGTVATRSGTPLSNAAQSCYTSPNLRAVVLALTNVEGRKRS